MTPQEWLTKIKDDLNGINREYPFISSDHTEWLISRVEQLEKALNYIVIAQMGELDYTKDFFELTKNVTREVLKEMPKK